MSGLDGSAILQSQSRDIASRATTAHLLTPPGRGGIAVLALRGPADEVDKILQQAFRPVAADNAEADACPAGGALRLGHIVDDPHVIDQAIVARRGELAEINIHGGPAAAAAVLRRLADLGATVLPAGSAAPCFALAHPLWDNPAIGAEMLQMLPAAASVTVAAALTCQWSAGLSELAAGALRLCGQDIPPAAERQQMAAELREAAANLATMRRLQRPAEVVLAGPPNAGKSTLANALTRRAVSIVHDSAGTTRDWVREPAILAGLPVWLTDTAGLWSGSDELDTEAVKRSAARIASADLVLLIGAGRIEPLPDWLAGAAAARPPVLRVATKIDLAPPPGDADAAVCAPTGAGLDRLAAAILTALGLGDFDPTKAAAFTERQQSLLLAAADATDRGQANSAREAIEHLLHG